MSLTFDRRQFLEYSIAAGAEGGQLLNGGMG